MSSDIVVSHKFELSASGITLLAQPTYEEWAEAMERLQMATGSIQFWVGDMINIGEGLFGEMSAQVISAEGWSEETVRVYRWVSAKVPASNRRISDGLKFEHHQHVAALPANEQCVWLDKAVSEGWTTGRLRQELRAATTASSPIYILIVEFDSPADRDIVAQEHERVGRRVMRRERLPKEDAQC